MLSGTFSLSYGLLIPYRQLAPALPASYSNRQCSASYSHGPPTINTYRCCLLVRRLDSSPGNAGYRRHMAHNPPDTYSDGYVMTTDMINEMATHVSREQLAWGRQQPSHAVSGPDKQYVWQNALPGGGAGAIDISAVPPAMQQEASRLAAEASVAGLRSVTPVGTVGVVPRWAPGDLLLARKLSPRYRCAVGEIVDLSWLSCARALA